jgi:hypothetical protein
VEYLQTELTVDDITGGASDDDENNEGDEGDDDDDDMQKSPEVTPIFVPGQQAEKNPKVACQYCQKELKQSSLKSHMKSFHQDTQAAVEILLSLGSST